MPFKKGQGRIVKGMRLSIGESRTPTRRGRDDVSDEEMADADGDDDMGETGEETPAQDDIGDDAATPAAEEEEEDEEEDAPPQITTLPRRRGRPRGSGNVAKRPARRMLNGDDEDGSESGTPRRKRGRPVGSGAGRGRGGFRGRRKGQQPEQPRVVIDKQGNTLDVENDEAIVDDDDEGNAKVDENGNLLGGREYRVRTFTIADRGERLYMLSTEPARCCGFRDSYLFFTKHPKLYKVLISDEEKMDLIGRDVLPNSYKGRNIGVVTARSVFREFGARIIVGGRRVTDDYKTAEARENGEVEGELADPDDHVPDDHADYNRNRYVAWFGASDVYRTQASGVAAVPGKPGPIGRKRANITLQNWQTVHAKEANRFNSELAANRHANLQGIYDCHTNMMFYPTIMQPTHAKWEQVPPPPTPSDRKQLTNGLTNGYHHQEGGEETETKVDGILIAEPTIFSEVPAVVSRNFTVIDTHFSAPPISFAGYPGPDGSAIDHSAGPNGLASVPADILDELPDDCRQAFEEARALELQWKGQWSTEKQSAHRGVLKIGFNGYPV